MRTYNGMKFSTGEEGNKMADILAKCVQNFFYQTQELFEHFKFNHRDQASGDSIGEYLSVLRNIVKTWFL